MNKKIIKDETRAKLITVGRRLFAEKGFSAVSIREIASVAKVNSSLISYYFGGKQGLYFGIMQDHTEKHRETINDLEKAPNTKHTVIDSLEKMKNDHEGQEIFLMVVKSKVPGKKAKGIGQFCFDPSTDKLFEQGLKVLSKCKIKNQYKTILTPLRILMLSVAMMDYWKLFSEDFNVPKEYMTNDSIEEESWDFVKGMLKEFLDD
jgi:AcrR family transcriptional regulator